MSFMSAFISATGRLGLSYGVWEKCWLLRLFDEKATVVMSYERIELSRLFINIFLIKGLLKVSLAPPQAPFVSLLRRYLC